MSGTHRERAAERIPIELIEADFEIAFNLIELAGAELEIGDLTSASRARHDADDVFHDIERRLALIGTAKSRPFASLVEDLKRELSLAKSQAS